MGGVSNAGPDGVTAAADGGNTSDTVGRVGGSRVYVVGMGYYSFHLWLHSRQRQKEVMASSAERVCI